jgi:hypothetical protein
MTLPNGIFKSALEQSPFPSQDWDDNIYSNRDAEHFQSPDALLVGVHVRHVPKVDRSANTGVGKPARDRNIDHLIKSLSLRQARSF